MPVVTISRQFGAGGRTLGEKLSRELDCPFYDNEIIQLVAKRARVSEKWAKAIEKGEGGQLSQFMSSLVPKKLIDRILSNMQGYMDEEIFVELLHKIIINIADQGDCIILGRGSQYVLQEYQGAYHVLLIADMKDRIKFMEENYDLLPTQARIAVENEDKRRMNLYRKFGREDYDQPGLYHVVLNMSKISIENAIELIIRSVNRLSSPKRLDNLEKTA